MNSDTADNSSCTSLRAIEEAERKGLQAFFDGHPQQCTQWFDTAVSLARCLSSVSENPAREVVSRVYLNRCRQYVISLPLDTITATQWQEIQLLANASNELMDKATTHPGSADVLVNISCFLGLSSFYLKKYTEALTTFQDGKQYCSAASKGYDVPGFGHTQSSTSWDIWIQKSERALSATKPIYRKDWAAIEKELDKELEEDEEAESKVGGEASFQKLLQTIYAQADDDTRRAMMKSYQTSAGTVLSTNWNEVSKTDYENETSSTAKTRIHD